MHKLIRRLAFTFALLGPALGSAYAGGTLTPVGSTDLPIQIRDHHVDVLIQNGFARTRVSQTFFNPNATDLEAIYRVPIPQHASLAEMEMVLGESTLVGEVIARDEARRAYEEEKSKGANAGLAEAQETQVFDFHVTPVPAGGEASFAYVYYQPIAIDSGIGRFHYPLEDGGTDEVALAFWTQETQVQRDFSFHAAIESAWPIEDLRLPGLEGASVVQQVSDQRWEIDWHVPGGVSLDRDLVLYYRLADDLPGRIEMIPYRAGPDESGTFMLVVTPGIDLEPLTGGVDYVFVLDSSGSMSGKLATLANGVERALGQLDPNDRFRLISFSDRARDLCGGYRAATPENVRAGIEAVHAIESDGGTNVYDGLKKALGKLDDDRATSLILVTDGVTNTGIVDPAKFDKLMRSCDVRLFGFLMGNSANWPLMRTITEATGGFYASVSNADDVIGQIMLAKSKVTHAALHDVELSIDGVRVHDAGTGLMGKLYRGQQLVIFGRYSEPGHARIELKARITGEDKVYATDVFFPAIETDNPELERLWALDRIERLELDIDRGRATASEGEQAIRDLAVEYQLVTDETSMVVLEEAAFEARGIERRNRDRVATERSAQASRAGQAPRSYRVDTSEPAFPSSAPRLGTGGGGGNGGGAHGPLMVAVAVILAVFGRRRDPRDQAA